MGLVYEEWMDNWLTAFLDKKATVLLDERN